MPRKVEMHRGDDAFRRDPYAMLILNEIAKALGFRGVILIGVNDTAHLTERDFTILTCRVSHTEATRAAQEIITTVEEMRADDAEKRVP